VSDLEKRLAGALARETATAEILRVISSSRSDVQPVFDSILVSAIHLLAAHEGVLTRVVGDQLEHAASTFTGGSQGPDVKAAFPLPLAGVSVHAQALRDREPINVADVETHPVVYKKLRDVARARGYRSVVVVPLLRHDETIGTIGVARREPGGFTNDE